MILEVLQRAGMADCKPCSTPVDTCAKVSGTEGAPVADPPLPRFGWSSAVSYLHSSGYFLCCWVGLPYMHDPREPHYALIKRILCYLHGTLDYVLQLWRTNISTLVTYYDAWAGCLDNRHSTSGYAVFFGDNLVSWSSKRQPIVSCSMFQCWGRVSCSCKYCCWDNLVTQLLLELHVPLYRTTIVYCDNVSAVYLSTNPV
jgi:hypothetical protein